MYCNKCGNKSEEGVRFCGKCGASFADETTKLTSKDEESNSVHPMSKIKSVLKGVAYIIVVIVVFVGFRIFTQIGTSRLSGQDNLHDAVEQTKSDTLEKLTGDKSWKEFNSVEGKFSVSIPTFPDHTTNKIEIPNSSIVGTLDLYVSNTPTASYFVQAIRYEGDGNFSDHHAMLENALYGRLSEIENHKLTSSSFGKFGQYDSLDFVVQSGDYQIQGKLISFEQQLYSLEMVCKQNECLSSNFEKFTGSFKLQ